MFRNLANHNYYHYFYQFLYRNKAANSFLLSTSKQGAMSDRTRCGYVDKSKVISSGLPFYFEPPPPSLQSLSHTPLETQLFSSLLSTFKLGIHLSRVSSNRPPPSKINEKPFKVDETTETGKDVQSISKRRSPPR